MKGEINIKMIWEEMSIHKYEKNIPFRNNELYVEQDIIDFFEEILVDEIYIDIEEDFE